VPDPKYLARDTLRRKDWVKVGGWLFVAVLLAAGVLTRYRIALVFGVLYALALVMEKTVAVTQRGLEVYYDMRVTTSYELWKWDEVYAVTHEPDPKNSAQTVLYFTKGDRTRHFSFANGDAEGVLRLARERNPGVKVYDGTKERAEARQRLKR
jgi:hypothetical protein